MYYQSGNRDKDASGFNKFGLMIDFYQRLRICRLTFKEAKSRLIRFDALLNMLANTTAGRKNCKEKKVEVLKKS